MLCPTVEVAEFMRRVGEAMTDVNIVFVTTRPGAAAYLRAKGKHVRWVRPFWPAAETTVPRAELDSRAQFEWRHLELVEKRPHQERALARWATALHAGIHAALEELHPDVIVMWNSEQAFNRAAAQAASVLGAHTVYLEMGFLAATIVVENRGVNRASSAALMTSAEILQRGASDGVDRPIQWRSGLEHHSTPFQLRLWLQMERLLNRSHLLGTAILGKRHFGIRRRSLGQFLAQKLRGLARRTRRSTRSVPQPAPGFVLIPLQVAWDTQVLVNATAFGSIVEFVEFCLTWIPPELNVVIAPHPLDPETAFSKQLARAISTRSGTELARMPTHSLLPLCRAVVTLNSTVGLEALSLGLPVFTLGVCFYARLGLATPVTRNEGALLQQALRDISSHRPDPDLVTALLRYLRRDILVAGDFFDLSSTDAVGLAACLQRRVAHAPTKPSVTIRR